MTQLHLPSEREDGPVGIQAHDAITFSVHWNFEADTDRYWLSHQVIDPTTSERIIHGSGGYRWKEADAVGDCGLAVRWLREARRYLATPEPKRTRVK